MKQSSSKKMSFPPQPYLFVLQEGKKIQEDLLDYSLLLLQTSHPIVIRSPSYDYEETIVSP